MGPSLLIRPAMMAGTALQETSAMIKASALAQPSYALSVASGKPQAQAALLRCVTKHQAGSAYQSRCQMDPHVLTATCAPRTTHARRAFALAPLRRAQDRPRHAKSAPATHRMGYVRRLMLMMAPPVMTEKGVLKVTDVLMARVLATPGSALPLQTPVSDQCVMRRPISASLSHCPWVRPAALR